MGIAPKITLPLSTCAFLNPFGVKRCVNDASLPATAAAARSISIVCAALREMGMRNESRSDVVRMVVCCVIPSERSESRDPHRERPSSQTRRGSLDSLRSLGMTRSELLDLDRHDGGVHNKDAVVFAPVVRVEEKAIALGVVVGQAADDLAIGELHRDGAPVRGRAVRAVRIGLRKEDRLELRE